MVLIGRYCHCQHREESRFRPLAGIMVLIENYGFEIDDEQ